MPLACVCLTVQSTLMANSINQFMDDMHLNMSNSFTHLLDIESNEELNVIRHSPYSSDDELIESRMNFTTSMNILSMNCQSLVSSLLPMAPKNAFAHLSTINTYLIN